MGVKIQTIKQIRLYLTKELEKIYDEQESGSLAGIIIKTTLRASGLHQLYFSDLPVSNENISEMLRLCDELKTGKPLQYILGETIFYDLKIKLNSSTLIPRPETEELVDLIIRENKGSSDKIIDFGTGSGCIAIALAKNLPGTEVTGIDISEDALEIARENAIINNVSVNFEIGDILNIKSAVKADIYVSNPPYVRESEKQHMHRNVLDYEPHVALFVDDFKPYIFYDAILKLARKSLSKGGKVYFEINEALGAGMLKLLLNNGYSGTEIIKDINGRDRIIKGTKNE